MLTRLTLSLLLLGSVYAVGIQMAPVQQAFASHIDKPEIFVSSLVYPGQIVPIMVCAPSDKDLTSQIGSDPAFKMIRPDNTIFVGPAVNVARDACEGFNSNDFADSSGQPLTTDIEGHYTVSLNYQLSENEDPIQGSVEVKFRVTAKIYNLSNNYIDITGEFVDLAESPSIATVDNNVYVVWSDTAPGNRADPTGHEWKDVLFRLSNDNGATFGPIIDLNIDAGPAGDTVVTASESNVYVMWTDSSTGNWETFFRASNDNGATFGPVIDLSNSLDLSYQNHIAVSGSNVYALWVDLIKLPDTSYHAEAVLRASNDYGKTFGPPVYLGIGGNAKLAASGSSVYVLADCSMLFRASTDDGSTFSKPIDLDSSDYQLCNASLVASEGNVYVAWPHWKSDTRGIEILFSGSANSGTSFSSPINLGIDSNPQLAASGSNVYAVGHINPLPEKRDVVFTASSDNGASFGSTINLSNNDGNSFGQMITATDNNVHVAWLDNNDGPLNLFLRVSNDNGATFDDTVNLSQNPSPKNRPQFYGIAASGSNMYAAWQELIDDDLDDNPDGAAIFFTRNPPLPSPLLAYLDVQIDVNPSRSTLSSAAIGSTDVIDCKGKGKVRIGILAEPWFDPLSTDLSAMEFNGIQITENHKIRAKDLDGDGHLDAVVVIKKKYICESLSPQALVQASARNHNFVRVVLSGELDEGQEFKGADIFRIRAR